MIDHILRFADEATAQAHPVVGRFWSAEDGWRRDFIIPNMQVFRVTAVVDGIETRVSVPGWFMLVSLDAMSIPLRSITASRCRMILDRDDGVKRRPFARFMASDITPEQLATLRIEPVFAGSDYSFNNVNA